MATSLPVLIVGAGPVGLSMAIELKRRDIPFRIIDKQIKPVTTSNATVAQTRTLEIWDDMGVLANALEKGHKLSGLNLYSDKKRLFHIGGEEVYTLYPYVLGIPQHNTESVLHDYLKNAGVQIEMEVELLNCREENEGVIATLRHKNGEEETIHAQWLIGCDGIRSTVRSQLNIEFEGKELDEHFIVADLKLKSESLDPDQVYTFLAADGPLIIIPIDRGFTRVVAEVTYDPDKELRTSRAPTNEQVINAVKNRCPFTLQMSDPTWSSGFWIHERMAKTYHKGRIFLAGDACHVHAPLGGQGMNTGIQDIYNLAWKLALVIQGRAKKDLLESYQKERYDVARSVLNKTTLLTHSMTARNPIMRFIRNVIVSFFMNRDKNRKIFMNTATELGVNYKNSSIVKDLIPTSSGPFAGSRVLDIQLDKGRLFNFIRGTKHCLLLFTGKDADPNVHATCLSLQEKISKKYADLIQLVLIAPQQIISSLSQWQGELILDAKGEVHQLYGATKACLYLIRPDKYIGFRGEMNQADELFDYLDTIFVS